MTQAVLGWALRRLEAGEAVAIASVVQAEGSVPGKPGARLAVTSTGERIGTVGGAGLELRVEARGRAMLAERHSRGRAAPLADVRTYRLFKDRQHETRAGEVGHEAEVRTDEEPVALDSLCGGVVTVVTEVLDPAPHVLLMGGGHVASALALVLDGLGWAHSVQDTRADHATQERHPRAREVIHMSAEDLLAAEDATTLSRFSHLLLLGHDWAIDQTLLLGLLARGVAGGEGAPELGVIGSRRKWTAYRLAALDAGHAEALLARVHCPIGLDIGAETPEEIAVAVAAEMIEARRRPAASVEPVSW